MYTCICADAATGRADGADDVSKTSRIAPDVVNGVLLIAEASVPLKMRYTPGSV